jgi:hypothetical protein
MVFVSVFPHCFGASDDVINDVTWNVPWWHFLNFFGGAYVFLAGHMIITYEEPKRI